MKKQMMKLTYTMVAAGCLLTVTACSTEVKQPQENSNLNQQLQESLPESPMGVRKFINFNGLRYAVINEELDLSTLKIGNEIGQLSKLLLEENNFEGAGEDNTSTFSEDGKIFELEGYSTQYRVAVKSNDTYYLCEVVSTANDRPMDVKSYFETAQLNEKTKAIEIYDHMGMTKLADISEADQAVLLNTLSTVAPIEKTAEIFEEIGQAQVDGKSYLMKVILNDGTYTTFYIIPELNYVSVGDYTCYNAQLNEKVGDLFANLEQEMTDIMYE